ncbi:hypothetical protein B7463_g11612, partial [Scytalidium lignicola]
MMKSFLSLAVVVSTVSAIALPEINAEGIPDNLPANLTALYPPYTYHSKVGDDYHPNKKGIVLKYPNTTITPWEPIKHESSAAKLVKDQSCGTLTPTNPSAFWYENINHNGISPFITDGSSWTVYRNVKTQYGAAGNGVSDDTAAIQNAINAGNSIAGRNENSWGTTGQPAVVYLPSGTYMLSSPLQLYVGTVIMGNPLSPPVLKATAGFSGSYMIYGKDPNQGSTTNFYIGIKNIVIDSTNIDPATTVSLLDWSVSQATQLSNVVFNMPDYSTGHTGLQMPEGGSGTIMNDVTFNGGATGINYSNQQYMFRGITFNGCTTGIYLQYCYDCVFQGVTFENCATGIDTTSGNMGTITILDSSATNVGSVVSTAAEMTGQDSLIIENLSVGAGVAATVVAGGNTILTGSVTETWVYGNAYVPNGSATGAHQGGTTYTSNRPAALIASSGEYQVIKPPTYQQYDVTEFVNVKSVSGYPVYGDGQTDDTANLNSIISTYAGCKILFFPQGTYLVSNTIFFPAGSRVYGEAWSAISAVGSEFYNPTAPVPMVRVGNAGDKGVAQFSDMLFTVADVLQGCTLVEVNIAGNSPGDVGFWNSHFRIGGAAGSKVETNCNGPAVNCKAAYALLHLTPTSSAYIENMWGWTADHDLDGGTPQTISTGRGFLIEATQATWLIGTAAEHNTLYQYNLNAAQNVFIAMQQCETPYWQGNGSPSLAPAPWTELAGDPDFSGCASTDAQCRMAFYQVITGGSNLHIYGSGFWTFFNDNINCNSVCQTNAIAISGTTDLYYWGINTRYVLNLIQQNGSPLVTENNNPGGWGAVVAAFLTDEN